MNSWIMSIEKKLENAMQNISQELQDYNIYKKT